MLRAIVFDFDGVIANSEPLHYRAFREVFGESGITFPEKAYYDRYLGYDDGAVFKAVAADQGLSWTAGRIAGLVRSKAIAIERLEQKASILFPGAAAAIRRAAALVPLAIASGALGAEIRRVLDREGLTPCFKAIVAADDTPAGKPAAWSNLSLLSAVYRKLFQSGEGCRRHSSPIVVPLRGQLLPCKLQGNENFTAFF